MTGERNIRRLAGMMRGVELRTEPHVRVVYGFDATGRSMVPAAVAFPRSIEETSRLMRAAHMTGVPVVMRGAGTGFSGGSVPEPGGLVVSTERLDRIGRLDTGAGTVEVEAGVVNARLQEFLERRGWFYPPDPASFRVSTIGGNIAENAGGPRAFKYGVTRRWVRSIVWVDAAGGVHDTAMQGLSALLCGAEGTLGAVCSARLGVLPLPEARRVSIVAAGQDAEAMRSAGELLAAGLTPGVLEFIDEGTMRCVGEYMRVDPFGGGTACLFLEIDGCAEDVEMQQDLLERFCRARSLRRITARGAQERDRLWEMRRAISPSLARRGVTKINEDVSLPLGRLAEAVEWMHSAAGELGLDCYLFGHCGDGNIHVNIMTDRRRADEMRRAEEFVDRLFRWTAAAGGTLSGEHGIGTTKRGWLGVIFSPAEISLQRAIQRAMDPAGLLNPGSYFAG
jgi:glycolate oxidase